MAPGGDRSIALVSLFSAWRSRHYAGLCVICMTLDCSGIHRAENHADASFGNTR